MNGTLYSIIILVVFFAMMYFMTIRPQKKYEEEKKKMIAALKIGDSIKTSSGFYGIVLGIENDVVIVEFGNDRHCRIPMDINAIEEVDKAEEEEA
ncbi:MAG: preprotein translocase subunit YajC [Lachnospiraceae bacterium]|nr:preprotein translocase subunit YajC [Lachnospiraceae bacterium]